MQEATAIDIRRVDPNLETCLKDINRSIQKLWECLHDHGWTEMDPGSIVPGNTTPTLGKIVTGLRRQLTTYFQLSASHGYENIRERSRKRLHKLPSNRWAEWIIESIISYCFPEHLTIMREKTKEFLLDLVAPNR